MPSPATECRPNRDPWTLVRRWPVPSPGKKGLSPVAKIVWCYLFQIAGGVDRSVVAHAQSIGRETGLSERAARRALSSLVAWQLIKIADRFNGELTIDLDDPQRVARMRLVPAESSGQGELQFPDTPGSPAEVTSTGPAEVLAFSPVPVFLSDPPADLTPRPPPMLKHSSLEEISQALSTQSTQTESALVNQGSGLRGERGGFDAKTAALRGQLHADPSIEEKTLAAAIDPLNLAARIADLGQAQDEKAKEIARWIHGQLGAIDPKFLRWAQGKCKRIAWAILEDRLRDDRGRSTQELVSDVLKRMRAAPVRTSRAAWFFGTIKEEFRKAGQAWGGSR